MHYPINSPGQLNQSFGFWEKYIHIYIFFFQSHAFLRQKHKQAMLRVRNRRDFEITRGLRRLKLHVGSEIDRKT